MQGYSFVRVASQWKGRLAEGTGTSPASEEAGGLVTPVLSAVLAWVFNNVVILRCLCVFREDGNRIATRCARAPRISRRKGDRRARLFSSPEM